MQAGGGMCAGRGSRACRQGEACAQAGGAVRAGRGSRACRQGEECVQAGGGVQAGRGRMQAGGGVRAGRGRCAHVHAQPSYRVEQCRSLAHEVAH